MGRGATDQLTPCQERWVQSCGSSSASRCQSECCRTRFRRRRGAGELRARRFQHCQRWSGAREELWPRGRQRASKGRGESRTNLRPPCRGGWAGRCKCWSGCSSCELLDVVERERKRKRKRKVSTLSLSRLGNDDVTRGSPAPFLRAVGCELQAAHEGVALCT